MATAGIDSSAYAEPVTTFADVAARVEAAVPTASATADGRDQPAPKTVAAGAPPRVSADPRPVALHDDQFKLYPVTADTLPFLYQLAVSEEVGFRWRFRGAVPSFEAFQAAVWQGVLTQFVVQETRTGQAVGTVSVYNADHSRGVAYLATAFVPRFVRTGQPINVVKLFLRYVLKVWKFRKIYMEMPEYNFTLIASGEGRYFDVQGCLTDHNYYDGRYWHEYVLSIRPEVLASYREEATQDSAP